MWLYFLWTQNAQIDDFTSKIQVMHWNEWAYPPIVEYTSQYVNVLIFLHYFAIVLVYLKSKEEIYLLEVSTDQWRSARLARRFSPNLIFPKYGFSGYSKISRFLERFRMEHIKLICSLESELTFIFLCFIKNRSKN